MPGRPISFSCEAIFPQKPEEIANQILDLSKWSEFNGYGPLPGIRVAEFEKQTPEIVGTQIRVTNRDGSTHVEEILEWEPSRRLLLQLHEFSPPLSRLASSFDETWEFERHSEGTHVVRTLILYPKTAMTRLLLWLISFLLKRAIARHLEQIAQDVEKPESAATS